MLIESWNTSFGRLNLGIPPLGAWILTSCAFAQDERCAQIPHNPCKPSHPGVPPTQCNPTPWCPFTTEVSHLKFPMPNYSACSMHPCYDYAHVHTCHEYCILIHVGSFDMKYTCQCALQWAHLYLYHIFILSSVKQWATFLCMLNNPGNGRGRQHRKFCVAIRNFS
jgi:hypothetical protein